MKRILILAVLMIATLTISAQRHTDLLDRGLVAIQTTSGIYCSWRIMGEEYYDVTYNLYRDGVKIAEQLKVSNFTDAAGTTNSKYTVKAVVRGVEQSASKEATPWAQNYLEITPDHGSLTSTYVPNDACCADVDGDGELEILMKFDNASWAGTSYQKAGFNGEYFIIEVFKLNGKKLWWVDLGPNMADFQNNEQNIIAYDWDQDGKAEAVMRASDGTVIHMADGTTQVIGDATKNYLPATSSGQWFVHEGNEFLVYMNGETGKPYQVMEYPLKRLEDGETSLEAAWGDGYGHRSTKHFFGAPVLDGRKASIFLARGIYTRHKMIALDVNSDTHELTERWRWNNNTPGSPWYGQGYHNYAVADVDWDGRDEICFGSMVIDDNGHGLSTTGLGHGDAQHHGDFNPYIHGHEIFACNEDAPSNNYRDATTSKIYYRVTGSDDDGRSIAGNFCNDYPGAMAFSAHDEPISCVVNNHINGLTKASVADNFRIYWDGDLQEETQNYSNGKNTAIAIYKYAQGEIDRLAGSMTNNDTKGTPCYQGDLFGDWREEVIARTKENKIRIYTTTIPTEWRNYTLWHDMQYRQAMVWQMCGYNQPPHTSYFLGELEGITQAPPALSTTGRIEVKNGGQIGDVNTQNPHWLLAETCDATVSVQDGCSPYIVTVNTPSWVQGHDDNSNITTEYFTHTLTGGAFAGTMRLVKQGDGILVLPDVVEKYTGNTDVWAGTLRFNGTLESSPLWLNRHTTLESDGGVFKAGIKADYNATLSPGTDSKAGVITTTDITLGFGSRVIFDVFNDGSADQLKATSLTIGKKEWQHGPQYNAPVFQINAHNTDGSNTLAAGNYELAVADHIAGPISDIVVEGISGQKYSLNYEDGKVILKVAAVRPPADVVWDGAIDGIWDIADTENFMVNGSKDVFVSGDAVTFNDNATGTTVRVADEVMPASIVFDASKDFTIEGTGNIIGDGSLTKKGTGSVTINNVNKYTGGTILEGGRVVVSSLANSDGIEYGSLGGPGNSITFNGGTLSNSKTMTTTQPVKIGNGNGTIDTRSGTQFVLNGTINGEQKELTKTGAGTLALNGTNRFSKLIVGQGVVQGGEVSDRHQYPTTIVLNGGALKDPDNIYSYSSNSANIVVPEGKTATWTLDSRCDYHGKLTGAGTLTVNVTSVRSNMQGDWSQFEGTIIFQHTKTGTYDPLIQWNNAYGLGKATVMGPFDNNSRDVTIGTLSDKATLTGDGQYTVRHIVAKITKTRSGIASSYFEVGSALTVTDDITVTYSGSYSLKAGERVTLWKAGSFSCNKDVSITLPTLPDGLYWDTSNLLKAEGVLSITNIPPTGINEVRTDGNSDGRTYTLSGMPVENPTKKGVYIRNGKKFVVK